jgi:hypothetical protein
VSLSATDAQIAVSLISYVGINHPALPKSLHATLCGTAIAEVKVKEIMSDKSADG